jgi:hypothetical protein
MGFTQVGSPQIETFGWMWMLHPPRINGFLPSLHNLDVLWNRHTRHLPG